MERGSSESQGQSRSKSRGRKSFRCYNCGMREHLKKDCQNKKSIEKASKT